MLRASIGARGLLFRISINYDQRLSAIGHTAHRVTSKAKERNSNDKEEAKEGEIERKTRKIKKKKKSSKKKKPKNWRRSTWS